MRSNTFKPPSRWAAVVFDLFDPVAFGFLVGGLVFDLIYASSPEVMWFKSAAWLISIGLVIAFVPRMINLVQVWFPGARPSSARARLAFWMHLFGIVAAIFNAFVHSRDAYGVLPEGVWLSIVTVVLLAAGNIVLTLQKLDDTKVPT